MISKLKVMALVAGSMLFATAGAAEKSADDWTFALTPYLWLPTISGDTHHSSAPGPGAGSPSVNVGPTDWLDFLNFAALVSGTAQKGKWSIYGDVVYLDMGSDNGGRVFNIDTDITGPGGGVSIPVEGSVTLDTETNLDGLSLTLGVGYMFRETGASSHSVVVGLRTLDLDITTSWNLTADITLPGGSVVFPAQGSIASDTSILDGIVGLRGEVALGDSGKWSMPYYIDVGTGDSDLTTNIELIAARKYGWGELIFGYRYLYYDEGPNGTLEDFSFSGPLFGARFSF